MSLTTPEDDDVDYEDETPFLKNDDQNPSLRKQTSLPIKQVSFLLLPWIAESIVDHSISPYLNQVRMTAATAFSAAAALLTESAFSLSESSQSWAEMFGRWGTTLVL